MEHLNDSPQARQCESLRDADIALRAHPAPGSNDQCLDGNALMGLQANRDQPEVNSASENRVEPNLAGAVPAESPTESAGASQQPAGLPHSLALTVLRSRGPVLAKTWLADGTIGGYDKAQQFTVTLMAASTIDALHNTFTVLARDPRACFIRGQLIEPLDHLKGLVPRRLTHFRDAPHTLMALDIDGYTPPGIDPVADPERAIEHYIEHKLPTCFHRVSYVYHLSGSMGHPTKPSQLRCHLYFLLAEPLTCEQAELWVREHVAHADHTVQRVVQVNYTSDPVLMGGQVDPLAGRRLGFQRGYVADTMDITGFAVPDASRLKPLGGMAGTRGNMRDPREKPGVVGALCRVFAPGDIVTLCPEHFTQGSTPKRITWLAGGGTPEGVVITDDGLHLYSSHHTAPVQHACNLFEFIRAHVYGHLDDGEDPDVLRFAPATAPSYEATVRWAQGLPEVLAELQAPEGQAAEAERIEAKAEAKADKQLSEAEQRAERLERVKTLVAKASADELELKLCREVAKIDWTKAEREALTAAVAARWKQLIPPNGLPKRDVRRMLAYVPTTGAFPHVGEAGEPKLTIENVAALLARRGWGVRYNVITKRVEVQGMDDEGLDTDNEDGAQLSSIVSAAGETDIPQRENTLKGFVLTIANRAACNPVRDWIESVPWDGVTRVQTLLETLTLAEGVDAGLAHRILRRWLVQAVAGALSSKPLQLRGVLCLQGEQNEGKTRWFQRLAGPLEALVRTGHLLDPHNKDSVMLAVSAWITELGELDATMSRAHSGALKAFLSLDRDILRLPYAATPSRFQRRTAFAASVNTEQFLVDETGNARYWVLSVTAVNPDHGIDMQQVWAEVAQAWRAGEAHYFTKSEMAEVMAQAEVHEVASPVKDKLRSVYDWPPMSPGRKRYDGRDVNDSTKWVARTATDIAQELGLRNPSEGVIRSVGVQLGKLGACKMPRSSKIRGWYVPVIALGFEAGDE